MNSCYDWRTIHTDLIKARGVARREQREQGWVSPEAAHRVSEALARAEAMIALHDASESSKKESK